MLNFLPTGKEDCRFWLIERCTKCFSSKNKILLLNLSTQDSITLKIYGFSVSQHLSNCVIQQLKYLQESNWVTFGDKDKKSFEVQTVQIAHEHIMLKVGCVRLTFILGYEINERIPHIRKAGKH